MEAEAARLVEVARTIFRFKDERSVMGDDGARQAALRGSPRHCFRRRRQSARVVGRLFRV